MLTEDTKILTLEGTTALVEETKKLVGTKVDMAQGAENAGKILAINEDGNVELDTLITVDDIDAICGATIVAASEVKF